MSEIHQHLSAALKKSRIVVWNDPLGEFQTDFAAFEEDGVEKREIKNDEFARKFEALRGNPVPRYVLYRTGDVKEGIDNWLFDVELFYAKFSANKIDLAADVSGLPAELRYLVSEHSAFFADDTKRRTLKGLLGGKDSTVDVRAKMLAVCCNASDHRLDEIVGSLLEDSAKNKDGRIKAIAECNLTGFLFDGLRTIYGYESVEPSLEDFALWLFKSTLPGFEPENAQRARNARLFFSAWSHDIRHAQTFAALSSNASNVLQVEKTIESTPYDELLENLAFEVADQKILSETARLAADKGLNSKDFANVLRHRRRSLWWQEYQDVYLAIEIGVALLEEVDALQLQINSFDDGLTKYSQTWWQIDSLYRRFIYRVRKTDFSKPLEKLRDVVESHYSNKFLIPLNDSWQVRVDALEQWQSAVVPSQRDFFTKYVRPQLTKKNKVCVIISDAMRYEVAEELGSRIRQENGYDAVLEAQLGVLPSYTQLGMASLLPHTKLEQQAGKNALVLLNGAPSGGTENRSQILSSMAGKAVKATSFVDLTRDQQRELFRDNQLVYIYHDTIDHTGDKLATETSAFQAAEQALVDLVSLVKKAAGANVSNMLITADHGFIYQDKPVETSDFLSETPQGDEFFFENRRFVLGRNLKPLHGLRTFTSAQLGLEGDIEIQIPKSIKRLKRQGAGARFVHGGASLQEIVVPVLRVNKKKAGDVSLVDVDIMQEKDSITTNQFVVGLFQKDAVSDKVQARQLKVGLYFGDRLISNEVIHDFDLTSLDKRERMVSLQLVLSKDADDLMKENVELRLMSKTPKTTHWGVYRSRTLKLSRSFTSDFDL
ncbi:BREX-1 system phosphatase PglZ type A [Arthrobacter sp. IA7]|uniref:BREX-1 system phosphatase PglZ type A n=1 Tax=Arthrobacter ipis TaxID=2716202 RepID=UPI0016876E92|nr:BREX-1 system phosphatase PglZ type A [Arthrobacter ipis]MBD1543939.1 BREX-1 system phosphatase PglZ type A [Arthrobacter ipis]